MTSVNRTLALTGESKKLTISMWVKRSKISAEQWVVTSHYNGTYFGDIRFQSDDTLRFTDYRNSYVMNLITNAKFRDPNGFYHILCSFDSTVGSPQAKIYVNGQLQTLSTNTNYSQNAATSWTTDYTLHIGNDGSGTEYKGLISDFYFIQGYEYAPTVFAEEDATTGEWKPKTNASVNYSTTGTNSCHLKFENAANPDLDSGDNNLSFSTSGNLISVKDNPSNVFATWNPLNNYFAASTFSQGNNTIATNAGNYTWNTSTLGFQTGKWYWENKIVSTSTTDMFGITGRVNSNDVHNELGEFADTYGFNAESGNMHNNNTNTAYASAFQTNGNIVQIAVDMTNLKIHLGVNGVWQNSSNPSNNTGGLAIGAISTTTDGYYFVGIGDYSNSAGTHSYNFGNGYFGTTAVSSAGANASGIGIFEYDVPTGFTALSTKGLNL